MELRAGWSTDSMDGLNWSLLFHLIYFLSSVCKSLIEGMGAFSVCACMMYAYVCMSAFMVWINNCGSFHRNTPHSSMAFYRLTCSAVAGPHMGPCSYIGEHMWFCKAFYTSTPKLSSVFYHSPPKSATILPFENCSLMNKTHNATSLFLPSFSHFLPLFLLSICLGHHPLWI